MWYWHGMQALHADIGRRGGQVCRPRKIWGAPGRNVAALGGAPDASGGLIGLPQ
jgi:hypothetical protein